MAECPLKSEALERLWQQHRHWVAAVVYAHKPAEADLEDLMQDVAMRLIKHKDDIRLETIRPWLRTVAMNVACSSGRRATVHRRALNTLHEEARASDRDRPAVSTQHRGVLALELTSSLPLHYREPLLLNLRGLSQREIAEALELPLTTIETRLIRARRMLRDALETDTRAQQTPEKSWANAVDDLQPETASPRARVLPSFTTGHRP
ncbi:MAG: RNA polymerase sigma factor [Phycisphaerales bacterium]